MELFITCSDGISRFFLFLDDAQIIHFFLQSSYQTMSPQAKLQVQTKILMAIDSVLDLRPFGVVSSVDGASNLLRRPQTSPVQNHFVVVEVKTNARQISYESVAGEGAMAAPVTGGASLALTTVGYAATAATAIGCANSLARTYNALWSPATNSRWDDFPAYKTTMQVVDGVSLLGVGASTVAATRAVKVLRNSGVSIPSAISGNINRQQAALLTNEMIRLRRPNVSNGELKKLVKQGVEPKRYPAPQIAAGALKSLKDSVAAGLSFLSSAFDGNIKEVSISIVGLGT